MGMWMPNFLKGDPTYKSVIEQESNALTLNK